MEIVHTVLNPYNSEVVRSVRLLDASEIDEAIYRSAKAFERTKNEPAYKRAQLLRSLGKAVLADTEAFAQAIMREAGKPIAQARVEASRGAQTLLGSAEEASRIVGETLPLDTAPTGEGRFGITRRFPIGPISGISPFNFPLNLGLHKVGPALAAGNAILWKPPLQAPGAALLFAEHYQKAARAIGYPEDALQVVFCDDIVAEHLVTDPRIKMLSFTGSARVGWALRAKVGTKKVALELGGNAAALVGPDAGLDTAAKKCASGGYYYAGQICIAVQRVIVHESVYEAFQVKFADAVQSLKVGDPADERTEVGPMVSVKEADRVAAWIDEAKAQGATLLCGGDRDRLVFQPAVFTNVDKSMKIVSQEVFGPVVTLQKFTDWDEAFEMVNDSAYGLQAGIFANDIHAVMRAFEQLETGGLIVNDVPTLRIDFMPYGGVKESGMGREGMRYAVQEMTEPRLLVL